jgi:hypothetical protein
VTPKLLVKNILQHPHGFHWQVQGLGMLRIYLEPATRLHVWDRALLVPGASPLHDHPWDFTSQVIAGRMVNHRFVRVVEPVSGVGEDWNCVQIKCGEGAHTIGDPTTVKLIRKEAESYGEGAFYTQTANEIHWSLPEDGTVTMCHRRGSGDHANVFWRGKGPWVDAKPRTATRQEIKRVTQRALELWF